MISLYTRYRGDWSIIALLTVIVSSLSVATSFTLLIVYKFIKLEEVKQQHGQLQSARYYFLQS
jgi:hypothetical protein